MGTAVRIPTPLRRMTNGHEVVQVHGGTLMDGLTHLDSLYPGVKDRLIDATGELYRFVNIYINGEDIRFLQGLSTSLKDGDEISIVPAVAGGTSL